MTLYLKHIPRNGKWWILGDSDAGPIGPYDDEVQAADSRRGLERFHVRERTPGFVVSKRPKRKGKQR